MKSNPEHAQLLPGIETVNLPGAQVVTIDVSTNDYPYERRVLLKAKLQEQVAAGLQYYQYMNIDRKIFAEYIKTVDNTNKQNLVASLILRKISPELLTPGTVIFIKVDGRQMMLTQKNFELEKLRKTETTNTTRLRRLDDDYGSFDIVTKSTIHSLEGIDQETNATLINDLINKIQDKIYDGYALEEYIDNPLKLINDLQLSKEELFELSLVNCDLEMRFESLDLDEYYEQISFNTKDLNLIIEGLKEINIEKYTKPEVIKEVKKEQTGFWVKIKSIFK